MWSKLKRSAACWLPPLYMKHPAASATQRPAAVITDVFTPTVFVSQNKAAPSWQRSSPVSHSHRQPPPALLANKSRHIERIHLSDPADLPAEGIKAVYVMCLNKKRIRLPASVFITVNKSN